MNPIKQKKVVLVLLTFLVFMITISVSVVSAAPPTAHLFAATRTPTRTPTKTPTSIPTPVDAFTLCASQGGVCSFAFQFVTTKSVRYGANGYYIFKTVTNSIPCTTAAFGGDPIPSMPKKCHYTDRPIETNVLGRWTSCALEYDTCGVTGYGGTFPKLVRYGWGSSYVYKKVSSSIACTDEAFGSDPIPSAVKQCLFTELPNTGTWSHCADHGDWCDVNDGTVGYGDLSANTFAFKSVAPNYSIPCTDTVFGDPLPGTTEKCYSAPPDADSAGWVRCANQNGFCSSGGLTVAFGANGVFHYKTISGGTACTINVFGDPIPGTPKICYYKLPQ